MSINITPIIIAAILACFIKFILKINGYKISYFQHFEDIPNMINLIKGEIDILKKAFYIIILLTYLILIMYFFSFIVKMGAR